MQTRAGWSCLTKGVAVTRHEVCGGCWEEGKGQCCVQLARMGWFLHFQEFCKLVVRHGHYDKLNDINL